MKNTKLIPNYLVHMDTISIIIILIVMSNVQTELMHNIFFNKIDILIFVLIVINKIVPIVWIIKLAYNIDLLII